MPSGGGSRLFFYLRCNWGISEDHQWVGFAGRSVDKLDTMARALKEAAGCDCRVNLREVY